MLCSRLQIERVNHGTKGLPFPPYVPGLSLVLTGHWVRTYSRNVRSRELIENPIQWHATVPLTDWFAGTARALLKTTTCPRNQWSRARRSPVRHAPHHIRVSMAEFILFCLMCIEDHHRNASSWFWVPEGVGAGRRSDQGDAIPSSRPNVHRWAGRIFSSFFSKP